jgi:hypothetical protein
MMTQTKMRLKSDRTGRYVPEFAEAVGLSTEDQYVTLRFVGSRQWGEQTRQVRIERSVAEQLVRLLNDELEDQAWSF